MTPSPPVRRRRLLLAAALGAVAGCRGAASPVDSRQDRPTVRVTHPVVREVTEYCYFTGRTEAPETVDLQSRVTGYLEKIEFAPGDAVRVGQELFKIDPRPYQAKLDIATAQVQLAKARLALAEADLRRAQDLMRTPGVISQAEVDKYVAAQTESAASVAAAEANAAAAQLDLDFTSVLSPIAGIVSRNYPSVGALIRQDDTLLTTIVSQDPIFAYFEVDEQVMLRVGRLIHEGKIQSMGNGAVIPVEMSLADEGESYPHRGTMDFINNRISPTTGTLEVRGVFDNPLLADNRTRMFKPGMFVRVRVPVGQPFQATLIPQAAIGTDQGRKFILVVNGDDKIERRIVELGPEQPGGLQVVDSAAASVSSEDGAAVPPLAPADRVVIGGLQLVRPGTEVNVRQPASSPAAPE